MKKSYSYPFHLEKLHSDVFSGWFDAFSEKLNISIFQALDNTVGLPRSKEEAEKKLLLDSLKVTTLRTDSKEDNVFNKLNSISRGLSEFLEKNETLLTNRFNKNFKLIDDYSRKMVDSAIEEELKSSVPRIKPMVVTETTGLRFDSIAVGLSDIPEKFVSPKSNITYQIPGLTDEYISSVVENNVSLIKNLSKDHFESVKDTILDGIRSGKSITQMKEELVSLTGVNSARAKFWARDQSSKFFGKVSQFRQKSAGFPGFNWMTVSDTHVRITHSELHEKYFDWDKGTGIANRNFPGDEWGCRCYAKPAFPPKDAKEKASFQFTMQEQFQNNTSEIRNQSIQAKKDFDEIYSNLKKRSESYLSRLKQRENIGVELPKVNEKSAHLKTWNKLNLDKPENWTEKTLGKLKNSLTKKHGIKITEFLSGQSEKTTISEWVENTCQEVIDFLPKEVAEHLKDNYKLTIKYYKASDNVSGSFNPITNDLKINLEYSNNLKDLKSTIYHEWMHYIHFKTNGIEAGAKYKNLIENLFKFRTKENQISLFGRYKVKKDKFYDSYSGLVHGIYGEIGVELTSTHFELLAHDEKFFALLKDPKKNPIELLENLKRVLEIFK
ncbi:minor capsid protein [Leptospira noguchii]|uniref:phage head morphogenesis protein n=1 Tax=Leptospira noguchii TaxID=28182 RepID=UPI001FB81576|nr:minor capsid protein [Leptospira noguchii]UOG38423.1 minor capsid protein [Leptospira noguchii]